MILIAIVLVFMVIYLKLLSKKGGGLAL